jgi:hypothetical protein
MASLDTYLKGNFTMHFMTQLRRAGRSQSGSTALALVRRASLLAALPIVEHHIAHQSAERPDRFCGELQRCRRRVQLGLLLRAGR